MKAGRVMMRSWPTFVRVLGAAAFGAVLCGLLIPLVLNQSRGHAATFGAFLSLLGEAFKSIREEDNTSSWTPPAE